MHLAYFHFLGPGAPGLVHVNEFAAATRGLGNRLDVHAMKLDPGFRAGGSGEPGGASTMRRLASRYLHEPRKVIENVPFSHRQREILKRSAPDVVLVRNHTFEASCGWVSRLLRLPYVIEFNAPAFESRRYFDQYAHLPRLPEALESWKLRQADSVTVVSSDLKSHIVATHHLEPTKVFVNPNGANTESFSPGNPRDSEVNARFAGSPVVGFVGSFQKWHGIDLLSGLVMRLARRFPEARFLFVGSGPCLTSLKEDTAPLGERVLFTGRVEHERVPGLVSSLDVAVMPESNPYGSPLKVLEWMAAGRTIVAPQYGPLEDIIDSEIHGRLFPPGNQEALVAAVSELMENQELRTSLGLAAAARVSAELTWEHNAERALEACRFAVQRRARVEPRMQLADRR